MKNESFATKKESLLTKKILNHEYLYCQIKQVKNLVTKKVS